MMKDLQDGTQLTLTGAGTFQVAHQLALGLSGALVGRDELFGRELAHETIRNTMAERTIAMTISQSTSSAPPSQYGGS